MSVQMTGLLLAGLMAGVGQALTAAEVPQQQGFVPGKWEFDIQYNFVGLPQTFPSYSTVQCLDEANPVPDISRVGHECRQALQGEFGRTYTWQLNCSTEWEMVHGMGRIHYREEKATGDVHLQVINPFNPPQPMVFYIEGRRLGNCDD